MDKLKNFISSVHFTQIMTIVGIIVTLLVGLIPLLIWIIDFINKRKSSKKSFPRLELVINDSVYINTKTHCIYKFFLTISNLSEDSNSIRDIFFNIDYEYMKQRREMKLSYLSLIGSDVLLENPLPINLNGYSSKSINISFPITTGFKMEKRFIKYEIELCDILSTGTKTSTTIIHEKRINDPIKKDNY